MELLPPPLASSLPRLYLGENRIMDEYLHPLMILKDPRLLNTSFKTFQRFQEHGQLRGSLLRANKRQDLHRLKK
jgi:adenylate cyclase